MIDAAVWAMSLMNFKFYRDALSRAGVGPNDIGYNSHVQDWRFQKATPNNTALYIHAYWTIEDGVRPIVFEMPPSAEGAASSARSWMPGRDRSMTLAPRGGTVASVRDTFWFRRDTMVRCCGTRWSMSRKERNFGFAVLRPILDGAGRGKPREGHGPDPADQGLPAGGGRR